MTTYVINKSSRMPSKYGYAGPACQRAGVVPGRVYTTREDAEHDVALLNAANPVGFVVNPIPD